MAVIIQNVVKGSLAAKKRIAAGDRLVSVNGHEIHDFLDYDFYLEEDGICLLEVETSKGKKRDIRLRRKNGADLGLEFESFLMDEQRRCRNGCVFCFIDQMPKGMRESLYFKDDDSRLSFLFGNYITLTNLAPDEVTRILEMHISPMNVSVHTTNPELRCRMMRNRFAGESLEILRTFAAHGIALNCQLVLCPGWNDKEELSRSLRDLLDLGDALRSVSAVPVGLTAHREGLEELHLFDKEGARDVIARIDAAAKESFARDGFYRFHASDEFYILAGMDLPEESRYDDFPQLENGVGMCVSLENDFMAALEEAKVAGLSLEQPRRVTLPTGMLAAPLLEKLAAKAKEVFPFLQVDVFALQNKTFGKTITVAGLLAGKDLIDGLTDKPIGEEILLCEHMLESTGSRFLDDLTPSDLEEKFGVSVRVVEDDGHSLLSAMLGRSLEA
ncbi:MAG: DUF512 domain-containing protein [Oscillospiraceae bacterium]|nr:DUF512 domain-containing protein [Oscillospiraceae bacterium]